MEKFELITLKIFNLWDPVDDKNLWEAVIKVLDSLWEKSHKYLLKHGKLQNQNNECYANSEL